MEQRPTTTGAQRLVENYVLGIVGCVAGLAIARALVSMLETALSRGGGPYWVSFRLDGPTTLFAVGLAFGMAVPRSDRVGTTTFTIITLTIITLRIIFASVIRAGPRQRAGRTTARNTP